jgi:hypothetical protein
VAFFFLGGQPPRPPVARSARASYDHQSVRHTNCVTRIGWNSYIVFSVWTSFEAVVSYFFLVETKGCTLEELDKIFAAK